MAHLRRQIESINSTYFVKYVLIIYLYILSPQTTFFIGGSYVIDGRIFGHFFGSLRNNASTCESHVDGTFMYVTNKQGAKMCVKNVCQKCVRKKCVQKHVSKTCRGLFTCRGKLTCGGDEPTK